MKRTLLVSILILAVIGGALTWLVRSGWATRFMLSYEGGLAYQTVFRVVRARIPDGADRSRVLNAFRDYFYLNVISGRKIKDLGPIRILINGRGFCDQAADILIRMIEPLGVRAYLVFLDCGHSVAYLTPGHPGVLNASGLYGQAMVVDVIYGFTYRSPNGRPASPRDICQKKIPGRPPAPDPACYCRPPQKIFKQNRPWPEHGFIKRAFYKYIFPLIPESWLSAYLKLAYWLDPGISPAQYLYVTARIDNLFFRFKEARDKYRLVERSYPGTLWSRLARYYRSRLDDLARCFPPSGYTGPPPRGPVSLPD